MIQMRRWFHEHPELSLKEKNTSYKIQEELKQMGIPYEQLSPGWGVAAVIQGKHSQKTIAVRADIDALPVEEDTGLPFSSQNPGIMHACGHDAHTAILLGLAKVLWPLRDQLNGTVKLIFQSGEEIGEGYQEVLDYLESTGGADRVIGLHIWSDLPSGEILLLPGAVFAGGSGFHCRILGKGGHGARPDLANDPVKAACELVLKFASVPSNFYDVLDHSVISTGTIHGGFAGNTIPSSVEITGTLRYYKKEGLTALKDKMSQIASGVAAIYNVSISTDYYGAVLPVYNQPSFIPRARELACQVEGLRLSSQTDPICAGDDICFLLDRYPGFYAVLGGGRPDGYSYPQHHPKFDIMETELRKGGEFMARYVMDYLQ